MKYMVMLLTVLGLAAADFLTGIIKGYVCCDLSSRKMRIGGLNKLCELVVMAAACGLEGGLSRLGQFCRTDALASFAGVFTAGAVFVYITAMETISILENYAEICPDAAWVRTMLQKLRSVTHSDEQSPEKEKEDANGTETDQT